MKATIRISKLLLLLASSALAEGIAPKEVPPIVTENAVYSIRHSVFGYGIGSKGGFIQAHDPKTKELLWTVQVYMTLYKDDVEKDVQDVFIRNLSLDKDHNLLIVTDEKSRVYVLDLTTNEVTLVRREQPGHASGKDPKPEDSETVTTREIIRILEHADIRGSTTTHSQHITVYLKNGKRYECAYVAEEAPEPYNKMEASNLVYHFLRSRPADEVMEWAPNAELE